MGTLAEHNVAVRSSKSWAPDQTEICLKYLNPGHTGQTEICCISPKSWAHWPSRPVL